MALHPLAPSIPIASVSEPIRVAIPEELRALGGSGSAQAARVAAVLGAIDGGKGLEAADSLIVRYLRSNRFDPLELVVHAIALSHAGHIPHAQAALVHAIAIGDQRTGQLFAPAVAVLVALRLARGDVDNAISLVGDLAAGPDAAGKLEAIKARSAGAESITKLQQYDALLERARSDGLQRKDTYRDLSPYSIARHPHETPAATKFRRTNDLLLAAARRLEGTAIDSATIASLAYDCTVQVFGGRFEDPLVMERLGAAALHGLTLDDLDPGEWFGQDGPFDQTTLSHGAGAARDLLGTSLVFRLKAAQDSGQAVSKTSFDQVCGQQRANVLPVLATSRAIAIYDQIIAREILNLEKQYGI